MVRQELERRFSGFQGKVQDLGKGDVPNFPKKLRDAIFGKTDKQRDVLMRALDANHREKFIALEELLYITKAGRKEEGPVWKEFRSFLSGHKHFDIRNLKVASEEELAKIQRNVDRARAAQKKVEEATGIEVPVYRAQATRNEADLAHQFLLGETLPTRVAKALDEQSKAAHDASTEIIARFAERKPTGLARQNVRDASVAAIEARRAAQEKASSRYYERAFQKARDRLTEPIYLSALSNRAKSTRDELAPLGDDVIDEARELLEKARKHGDEMLAKTGSRTAKGSSLEESSRIFRRDIERELARLRKESNGKGAKASETVKSLDDILAHIKGAVGDLERLHYVKLHIDDVLKKTGTDNSLGSTAKKHLAIVQKELVDELVEQSPDYRMGRDEFIRMQRPIDELKYSAIGTTAKLEDKDVRKAGEAFFDPEEPIESIDMARNVILEQENGKAIWDQMVWQELHRRYGAFDGHVLDLGEGSVPNFPQKLLDAIFGKTQKQRDVLMRALDADQRKKFIALEELLYITKAGRKAPLGVIINELGVLLATIREAKFNRNRNARALADVMFARDGLNVRPK